MILKNGQLMDRDYRTGIEVRPLPGQSGKVFRSRFPPRMGKNIRTGRLRPAQHIRMTHCFVMN